MVMAIDIIIIVSVLDRNGQTYDNKFINLRCTITLNIKSAL